MFLFYADIVFLSTLSVLIVYPFTAVMSIQNAYHKHNQNNQKPDVKERNYTLNQDMHFDTIKVANSNERTIK